MKFIPWVKTKIFNLVTEKGECLSTVAAVKYISIAITYYRTWTPFLLGIRYN